MQGDSDGIILGGVQLLTFQKPGCSLTVDLLATGVEWEFLLQPGRLRQTANHSSDERTCRQGLV